MHVQTATPTPPPIRLIVGLGNPGTQHANNRHNIGFMVVDALARQHGGTWQTKPNHDFCQLLLAGQSVLLLKPRTYMNRSGGAVVPVMRFYKLEPAQLLVIHDDLDMPFGKLRLRLGGSSGGQNGIKDTSAQLGSDRYHRLKLGISRPPAPWTVVNWVLSNFQDEELELLTSVVHAASDAATRLVAQGLVAAQGSFNGLDLRPKSAATADENPARLE